MLKGMDWRWSRLDLMNIWFAIDYVDRSKLIYFYAFYAHADIW